MRKVYWTGKVPTHDDFGLPIRKLFYDARTEQGPWAIMSATSYLIHGIKLGVGYGQAYEEQTNGQWLKVAG